MQKLEFLAAEVRACERVPERLKFEFFQYSKFEYFQYSKHVENTVGRTPPLTNIKFEILLPYLIQN